MVKYITSGTYSFLNERNLYILYFTYNKVLKHMPLLRTVGRNVVGSTALVHCSLFM
jgi:hypothetical protein